MNKIFNHVKRPSLRPLLKCEACDTGEIAYILYSRKCYLSSNSTPSSTSSVPSIIYDVGPAPRGGVVAKSS